MHCRHPVQPKGGVCAICLKERLSKISGLRCGYSDAASMKLWKLERESATLNPPPLKQLLGQTFDHPRGVEALVDMPQEAVIMSQEVSEGRQSIACLIERDILEGHRRHSDVASRCCYEPSHNQLLSRSKSTSHLDARGRPDGKPLHLDGSSGQPQSGTKDKTVKRLKQSIVSSTMKSLVHHHDLQRGDRSPQSHSNIGHQQILRSELQGKAAIHPLLTKSKSTGSILSHHLTHNANTQSESVKRSGRRSPVELLIWHKKHKTSSVPSTFLEGSIPAIPSPCRKLKIGFNNSLKKKELLWRPLKIVFRWKDTHCKPFFSSLTTSSGCTPRSSYSSSSSGTQYAPDRRLHQAVPLPKLDNHAELPEHVMCGCRLHHLVSQVWGHTTFCSCSTDSADTRLDVDASVKQARCYSKVVAPRSSDGGQDVHSIWYRVSHANMQSSALEQGKLRTGVGDGQTSCNRVSKGPNRLEVAQSTSSPERKNSCSKTCSLSSSLPSPAEGMDTSKIYSNSDVRPGNACVVSIATLVSMDVST